MEQPLAEGIARLRGEAAGKPCIGFALITWFDIDGMYEDIEDIRVYDSPEDAEADLLARLDTHEAAIMAKDPAWRVVSTTPARRQTMPATGATIPGDWPEQVCARKYMQTSPYDSIYVRMLRIMRDGSQDSVERLLGMADLTEPLVRCLASRR